MKSLKISGYELIKSLRLPIAKKCGRSMETKKRYNRKDKQWKKLEED